MADVSIDATIGGATQRGLRSVVFVSEDVGYWFYVDSNSDLVYSKTSNGGSSWGAAVTVHAGTVQSYDVWFDQWVPGDSGTLVHCGYLDSGTDDLFYRSLDTNGDTLGTERTVFAGATFIANFANFTTIAKARSGYIYIAYDGDAGAEKGFHRSTDGGATWSDSLDATFVEINPDRCALFPASGTGDDNDIWALYHDASTNELTLKLWDSSAGSATESSNIVTVAETATDGIGQTPFSGSIRHSDGHLIFSAVTERDTVTADHRVFDVTSTSTFSELTAITTDIDDHYYPAVFIDQFTDDIYVAFNGLRDGSETLDTATKVYYTKSTDDGSTWTSGSTTYMEDTAAIVVQVWAPLMGSRFYAGWRIGTTLLGNFNNSFTLAAATPKSFLPPPNPLLAMIVR